MRVLGFLVSGFFLLGGIPCAAAPACKVTVIYQHVPKTSKHFEHVLAKAKGGDRASQFQLGVAYETGAGVEQGYPEAAKWYRAAADLGEVAAQNNLGGLYLRGFGVEQDDAATLQRYLRAAGDGFVPAQNNVGFMYAAGRGTRSWYRRAAEKGYAPAQANLGMIYAQGRGVPRDGDEAVRWYRQAIAQSYAPAEFKLGLLYYEGTILTRNYDEALRWFHKAVEHGSAPAENQIGYAYEHGQGVPQSYTNAEKWYQMAADHGLEEAHRNLALLRIQNASASAPAPTVQGASFAEEHSASVVANIARVPWDPAKRDAAERRTRCESLRLLVPLHPGGAVFQQYSPWLKGSCGEFSVPKMNFWVTSGLCDPGHNQVSYREDGSILGITRAKGN